MSFGAFVGLWSGSMRSDKQRDGGERDQGHGDRQKGARMLENGQVHGELPRVEGTATGQHPLLHSAKILRVFRGWVRIGGEDGAVIEESGRRANRRFKLFCTEMRTGRTERVRGNIARVVSGCVVVWGCLAFPANVRGQLASLDKGHQLLVNSGLQIWGCDTGASPFNYSGLTGADMNGVMWSFSESQPGLLTTGQKWGKWVQPDSSQPNYTSPASSLNATESAHYADLTAIQVGDEQQPDLENPSGYTKAWFDAARSGNYFSDKLLYVNSTFVTNITNFFNFIGAANPDALSFDAYPFGTTGVQPYNWLGKAQIYRRSALGSYIGASGNPARPYGLYLQSYHGGDGARDPGDLEMRWQQFTAWTLGYTFVDAFTVGGSTSLFNGGNMGSPNNPRYSQFAESARESRNLGPALTKLISYGYGPNIVLGKDSTGATNPVPNDWPVFNKTNEPPNQQYLTSLSAQNLGSKNGGQPGDVYVGFFNPLLSTYGDPAGTAYFMVTNALGAYLNDPSLLVTDCTQRITMNFDFGTSSINSLERLRRSDGQVEVVPLAHLSGSQYQLTFDLDGGTGDLFKYNDGTPFVGVQSPIVTLYWDNDATGGNNNLATGAGLGGSGNWDNVSNKWFTGVVNGVWTPANDAVFWGTAGTVTLSSPQSANSLRFRTNGYTITGSTLTMTDSSITTDAGVTATIGSTVAGTAGLVKNGAGTLTLTGSNTYTGGTTVNGGVLRVSSDANLGAAPASLTLGNITLDGGTLQFGGNFDLSNNRGITLGAGGGTIDTQGFSNIAGYTQADGIQGDGDLTKIGTGTFFMNTPTGALNNDWKGNLILKQGTWKTSERGGLPYNANTDSVYHPAQVTFDGGTWQITQSFSVTSNYRGITIAAGGGTIDTQSFNLLWGGPVIGSVSSAVWNKIGSGQLTLNTSTASPGTYAGTLNVNGGVVVLNGGGAMGDTATINLANTAGVGLSITGGVETIGSLGGGGTNGGNVTLMTNLITGGNNASTVFGGQISGNGGLTKNGAGTFTLSNANGNSYAGPTVVAGGTLLVANTANSATGTGVVNINAGGTLGGAGIIQGNVSNSGDVAPGSGAGLLQLNGTFTQTSTGRLDIELASSSLYDLLSVASTANLAGNLSVSLLNGFVPQEGNSFQVLTASALNGTTFGTMSLPALTGSLVWNVAYAPTGLTLTVVLPGDFNGNGVVDAADYAVWRKGLGTKYTQNDYNVWRSHFGQTAASGSGVSASGVPEPGALVLAGIGLVAATCWRNRAVWRKECGYRGLKIHRIRGEG